MARERGRRGRRQRVRGTQAGAARAGSSAEGPVGRRRQGARPGRRRGAVRRGRRQRVRGVRHTPGAELKELQGAARSCKKRQETARNGKKQAGPSIASRGRPGLVSLPRSCQAESFISVFKRSPAPATPVLQAAGKHFGALRRRTTVYDLHRTSQSKNRCGHYS